MPPPVGDQALATITDELANQRLDMLVDEDELARRRAAWAAPSPRHRAALLAKYALSVGQADAGAVTHEGGVEWPHSDP